jgi:uncharacterized membrane-anchored protein YjiN (DUF445 family)
MPRFVLSSRCRRRAVSAGTADAGLGDEAARRLERAKWRLWHGRWIGCRRKLAGLYRWTKRKHIRGIVGIDRLQRHICELLGYLERNEDTLVHYAARRRRDEPISTAFVESAVNEIVAKRMNKKQQMRWNRTTVQPFLDVCTAVLNDALEDAFRHRYPGFGPPTMIKSDQWLRNLPQDFEMLSRGFRRYRWRSVRFRDPVAASRPGRRPHSRRVRLCLPPLWLLPLWLPPENSQTPSSLILVPMNDMRNATDALKRPVSGGPLPLVFAAEDAQRRLELRNARRVALGLLLGMAAGFLLTFLVAVPGFWTFLARHSIEAGLAGGLADWFAITALFRKPLGLPIPYTGIVEEQKDRIGRTVGDFVERNFLSPELIADRMQAIDPASRIANWLTSGSNAQDLVNHIAGQIPTVIPIMGHHELHTFLARALGDEIGKIDIAPVLGRALRVLSNSEGSNILLDRLLDGLLDIAFDNAERINNAITRHNVWWMPRSMDRRITNAILIALEDFVADLRAENSASRLAMRATIERIAINLIESEEHREQVERLRQRLVADNDVQIWLNSIWCQLRNAIIVDSQETNTESSIWLSFVSILQRWGHTLAADPELTGRVNEFIASAAQKATMRLHGEVGDYIADVVRRWDARTIADRMELTIGANLQFIRINGTLVGALVGCCLFLASFLLE